MSVFRKLALGGGGVKGILHIGALQELSTQQPLVFPDGIYGSSIGSIIATYIAFGLPFDRTTELTKKYLGLNKIIPTSSVQDMAQVFSNKGLFSMDLFEKAIIEMFLEAGLDIRNKTIGDAKMPLYIVASNITRGVPSLLTNKVPIVDALKCSCCLPGLFHPQELYGQIYIDGGIFTPCISVHAPDALCLTLKKPNKIKIKLSNIQYISPLTYMRSIYDMSMNFIHDSYKTENTLCLMYPNLQTESNLDDFDINDILKHSKNSMRNFLNSKSRNQKCPE